MSSQSPGIDRSAPVRARPRSPWRAALWFLLGAVATYVGQSVTWLVTSVVLDVPEGVDSAALLYSIWVGVVALPLVLVWRAGGHWRWFVVGGAAVMVVLVAVILGTA